MADAKPAEVPAKKAEGENKLGIPNIKKNPAIIIALVVSQLIIFGGAGVAVKMIWQKEQAEKAVRDVAAAEEEEAKKDPLYPYKKANKLTVELPPMKINLQTDGESKDLIFLRVAMAFGTENDETHADFVEKQNQIIDEIQIYLSTKSAPDLKGSAALTDLQHQLLERVNQVLVKGKALNVTFSEFLVVPNTKD